MTRPPLTRLGLHDHPAVKPRRPGKLILAHPRGQLTR